MHTHTRGEERCVNMHLCALTASGSLNSSSIQWGSYVIQVWLYWRKAHDLLRWIPRVTHFQKMRTFLFSPILLHAVHCLEAPIDGEDEGVKFYFSH